MQVKVSARHGHLGEDAHQLIEEKAGKLLHFFDRLTFIEVTVDLQKAEKGVEVIATAEHKHKFVGHASADDLQAAVGAAVDKAAQQIKHYKERIQDHRPNGH